MRINLFAKNRRVPGTKPLDYLSMMRLLMPGDDESLDKIIDPMETRQAITQALEAASLNPEVPEFRVGVLQT